MTLSLTQLRRSQLLWLLALGLGLLLRLWFLQHPMPLDDDTGVYAELGSNLFHHYIYGLEGENGIAPALFRLPGYPIFLALVFSIFGSVFGYANYTPVLLIQIALDLFSCWLVAAFARDHISNRAGTIAIFLAALCPFTAAYSTIALTECLTLFAISLGLWSAGHLIAAFKANRIERGTIILTSCAMALAMLLRPDGALLTVAILFAIVFYAFRQQTPRAGIAVAMLCAILATTPLVPWTIRNLATFHVLQPLAPRRVNDPGEVVNYGFYRWMSTWAIDIVSTGNVYWQVGTAPIHVGDLPSRAFDSPAERAETAAILAAYNEHNTITPSIDAQFDALARQRQRDHPILVRVWVPILRVTDMWLRPRTETLSLDADWWVFSNHHQESIEAIILGLVNLGIVLAAIIGFLRRRVPFAALPLAYLALRCLLISTMENSEPRYTMEAFPILFIAAAAAFTRANPPAVSDQATPAPAPLPADALPSPGDAG